MKSSIFKTILFIIGFAWIVLPSGCKDANPATKSTDSTSTDTTKVDTVFAKGADVSWVTQMENAGLKFYNAAGTQTECMTLLKSLGMNSVRLRVWVNPTDGWCNSQDVLTKALRAKKLGMHIMIDFHYSDTWADPSHQTKPSDWTSLSFADLKTAVTTHTTSVLNLLKTNNITVSWVQVGNETSDGMLWEDGRASKNMANYAALTTTGYNAVKAVFPKAKVIVHLSSGYDNSLCRWLFDGLSNNGAKWDVIGLSVYPYWFTTSNDWQACNSQCLANMNDMVSRYGKEVMIVECGMSWDSPTVCKSFLTDLIAKTKSVTNNKGIGVLYWEPECYGNWQSYSLGAFDNSGKPTVALNAFN
jgi:arabinogalactan endo-1,4-beta-galactosidase